MRNYEIPKEIKSKAKLFWGLYLTDLAILLVGFIFIFNVTESLVHSYLKIPYYIVGSIFLIYLIMPSPLNAERKNYQALSYFVKRDGMTYYALDINEGRNRELMEKITGESGEQIDIKNETTVGSSIPMLSSESNNKDGEMENAKKNKLFLKFKRKHNTEENNKKVAVPKTTLDILPYVAIDENYIEMKNGYSDIMRIQGIDLYSLNEDDRQRLIYSRTSLFRSFGPDIKEIAINYPSNTKEQRYYWTLKKQKTTNPLHLEFIERKLYELEYLEKNKTDREFYIQIFADSIDQLEERKNQIVRTLQTSLPILPTTKEKKEKLLFIMNNPNSKPN
ncbi:DUF5592 family protein [Heyndrickxia ginsengihumi]|uniref:DUF5592 family protein n=1 Tax=Heyndrickxia ginsengihumi TaxID=363870 RepID=UPI0004714B92|nr:DUF5592 family protein [Heyndrickxia ginsengihumi]